MRAIERLLAAHGGLEMWRATTRFSAHVSIGGALLPRRADKGWLADILVRHDPTGRNHPAHPAKRNLVVEGSTRGPHFRVTDAQTPGCYGIYTPGRIEIRDARDEVIESWEGMGMAFGAQNLLCQDQRFENIFLIGASLWNAVIGPFLVALPGVEAEVATAPRRGTALRLTVPPAIDPLVPERCFVLGEQGLLFAVDFALPGLGLGHGLRESHSAYWPFSGFRLASLRRLQAWDARGLLDPTPLIDIELHDVAFW